MYATPKRRPKTEDKSHKREPKLSSSIIEPPQNLFPSKDELLRLLAVLAIASSVALTCRFIAIDLNRAPKPFCDSNLEAPASLSDNCEPCPVNGECHEGKLECLEGYRKHGKTCVEDGYINQRAMELADSIESYLCEAYARYLCDGIGTIWVQEDDIWNDLDGENVGMDNAIYSYARKKAKEKIDTQLETRTNQYGKKELKCPDLLAEQYKPAACRIQQWIYEHALAILPISAMLAGFLLLLLKVRRRLYLSTRSEDLYHQVCDILEENALMSKGANSENEPWVVASQLRDHLLLPKERKDHFLWKKVEELVEEDSRIDQYPKLVKGESKVVWEWQVEGSLSSGRTKRRGETSKLKSKEGTLANSDKPHFSMKPGELLLPD